MAMAQPVEGKPVVKTCIHRALPKEDFGFDYPKGMWDGPTPKVPVDQLKYRSSVKTYCGKRVDLNDAVLGLEPNPQRLRLVNCKACLEALKSEGKPV